MIFVYRFRLASFFKYGSNLFCMSHCPDCGADINGFDGLEVNVIDELYGDKMFSCSDCGAVLGFSNDLH